MTFEKILTFEFSFKIYANSPMFMDIRQEKNAHNRINLKNISHFKWV